MSTAFKEAKEDFVSNLSGGPVSEVFLVTFVAPIATLLFSLLQSKYQICVPLQSYGAGEYFIDFGLNVLAILFAVTLYSPFPSILNTLLLGPSILILLTSGVRLLRDSSKPDGTTLRRPKRRGTPSKSEQKSEAKVESLPRKAFLTSYRGGMMVVTCLAILAVDFRVFPRRYAKVETWGTSLMDLGVGSFVFSSGVVSVRPLLQNILDPTKSNTRQASIYSRISNALRHSLPLIALGLVRLLLTKASNYPEHISEYGKHWNFFFTLALLPPFLSFQPQLPSVLAQCISLFTSALVVGIAHETLLQLTLLTRWALLANRQGLISANKEGIASFMGYASIFLTGMGVGAIVLPTSRRKRANSSNLLATYSIPLQLIAVASACLFGHYILVSPNLPLPVSSLALQRVVTVRNPIGPGGINVSRRLANLPYILWVCGHNAVHIFIFWTIDCLAFGLDDREQTVPYDRRVSAILKAYNDNGLPVFLVANILTGLINLCINSLLFRQAASMVVLGTYSGLLTAVAIYLSKRSLKLRL